MINDNQARVGKPRLLKRKVANPSTSKKKEKKEDKIKIFTFIVIMGYKLK